MSVTLPRLDARPSRLNQEPVSHSTRRAPYSFYYMLPFAFLHLGCLGVLWTGTSVVAVVLAVALFWVRMFAITGFYHRYFSHRAFQTNRFWQFVFAVIGMTSVQKGPLWWAAHHRRHHRYSDQPGDVHSPRQDGFIRSHIGWICVASNIATDAEEIRDFCKYPELRFINYHDWLVPTVFGFSLLGLGSALQVLMPQWHTSGWQLVVWGFFISTTVLFHATVSINSLCHQWGNQRFDTGDDSRNNGWLSIITMGEGWHNNHHFYPGAARQGFFWWEWDPTYYGLKCLEWLGIIHSLHPVPAWVYERHNRDQHALAQTKVSH